MKHEKKREVIYIFNNIIFIDNFCTISYKFIFMIWVHKRINRINLLYEINFSLQLPWPWKHPDRKRIIKDKARKKRDNVTPLP